MKISRLTLIAALLPIMIGGAHPACAAEGDDPGATTPACRKDAIEPDFPREEDQVRDRLAQDRVKLIFMCNYSAAAELYVEVFYDPQAPVNQNMYTVLYTDLLKITHKNVTFLDLVTGQKIDLTLEHGHFDNGRNAR